MAILLRKPVGSSSLLWLFMGVYNSHYIFFSLVVKSAHKMLSLTLSLRVRRLQEQKGFQVLGAALYPAGEMTLDQFKAIFSVCEVISEAYKDFWWIHQTHGAQLCLPKVFVNFLHTSSFKIADMINIFLKSNLISVLCRVSQPGLTLIYLFKSFIITK